MVVSVISLVESKSCKLRFYIFFLSFLISKEKQRVSHLKLFLGCNLEELVFSKCIVNGKYVTDPRIVCVFSMFLIRN